MSDLPPGWAAGTLSDLIGPDGLFTDGDWVETKDQDAEGTVRLTQLADVGEGRFRDRSQRYMREDQAERLHCTYLAGGDILVARMPDPLGRACLFPGLPQPAVTAVDVCIVRPGERSVDSKWLMWAINAPPFRARVEALQTGTTRKRISRKNLAAIQLPLPPLAEQRRIVAAIEEQFSRLDDAERSISDAKTRISVLRGAATREAFDAEYPLLPLVELTAQDRPICYGILMPKEHVANGVSYIRVRDFPKDKIDIASLRRTTREIAEKYRRSTLRAGDVLVSIRGTFGRVAVVPDELTGANITQDTARVSPGAQIDGGYLAAYLRSEPAQRFFRSVARGVAVKGVNIGDLKQLPVPMPPLDEQRRIVAEVEQQLSLIDSLRTAVESAQKRSAALRRAILERAFRGELVPQDPADEPASVLLDRIRGERAAAPRPSRRRATMEAS